MNQAIHRSEGPITFGFRKFRNPSPSITAAPTAANLLNHSFAPSSIAGPAASALLDRTHSTPASLGRPFGGIAQFAVGRVLHLLSRDSSQPANLGVTADLGCDTDSLD